MSTITLRFRHGRSNPICRHRPHTIGGRHHANNIRFPIPAVELVAAWRYEKGGRV